VFIEYFITAYNVAMSIVIKDIDSAVACVAGRTGIKLKRLIPGLRIDIKLFKLTFCLIRRHLFF